MSQDPDDHEELGDNVPTYVDAATVALRYASVALGPTSGVSPPARRPPVLPRTLRDAMGRLVTGVCVVTTVADGEDVAMTANSVTSVSLEPPMVLVCVAHSARFHAAITSAAVWGVSILDADSLEVSSRLARPGRPDRDQLVGLGHHRGAVTGVALLDSSCAELECVTEHVYPGGDHSIVVGRVVGVAQSGDSVRPLLFHRGQYSWLRP